MDKNRFLTSVQELGKIGWVEGFGLKRVTFSPEFVQGRDYIAQLMRAAGMQVRIDSLGSIFGRYEGQQPDCQTILVGSHIDSVLGGGIHDGHLGVLSALEAVRSLHEAEVLDNAVEVVGFNAEEGSPLGGTFGSRSACGDFIQLPSAETLSSYGLQPEDIYAAKLDLPIYKGFLELHIEQGPILWRQNLDIGIPTAIVGITRYKITVDGQANHAGTTPMAERQDAMRAATHLLAQWYELIEQLPEKNFVCNIGMFKLTPNEPPVIPARAEFVLEMRSTDSQVITMLTEHFAELLSQATLPSKMDKIIDKPPVELDKNLRKLFKSICTDMKIKALEMSSGAGHDASPLAQVMPAAMIFIPSICGISHAKEEASSEQSLLLGLEVLRTAIYKFDKL